MLVAADDLLVAVIPTVEVEVTGVRIVTVHQVGEVGRLLTAVQGLLLSTTEHHIIQGHIGLTEADTAVMAMVTEEMVGLEALF